MADVVTRNPASGSDLSRYPAMDQPSVMAALAVSAQAQSGWAATTIEERCSMLCRVADSLRERREELAQLAVAEMGKPVSEALAEVDKCAWVCEYYAQTAVDGLADEQVRTEASASWVSFDPLGVILGIMPWNFPFWQVFRFAAPALVSGNAVLLKHSPNVTGCSLAIEEVFAGAGLPRGLYSALVVDEGSVPGVVDALLSDSRVAAVSLTGSNRAGSSVASQAGRAIKKSLLELGGSDPFIVLGDADLDVVVGKAVASRYLNNGQSCLSAKRFIVEASIVEEFSRRLVVAVEALRVGDPGDPDTQIGPLAREDLADVVERQVVASVQAGARVLVGGVRLENGPAWFAPTVMVDVDIDMPVMGEETFGPVAAIVSAADDADAIRLANATPYGLGASVWSSDVPRALALARRVESGAVFVNAVVASDPRLPFGGVKQSGYGRELGRPGLREFTNVRTIVVNDPLA